MNKNSLLHQLYLLQEPPLGCPICKSLKTCLLTQSQMAREGLRFELHSCQSCGLWFSPKEDLQHVDQLSYYASEDFQPPLRESARLCLDHLTQNTVGSILEFGPGGGTLFRHLKKISPQTLYHIVDQSSRVRDYFDSKGVQTFSSAYESKGQYDAILAHHVIEHFQDIGNFFRQCHHAGKERHYLYLSFPNKDNFFCQRGYYPDLNLPDHRFYYSLNEVAKICESYGYEVLQARTIQIDRLKDDVRSCMYNHLRGNLNHFKTAYPDLLQKLEAMPEKAQRTIETAIEKQGLGTEAYLLARKL